MKVQKLQRSSLPINALTVVTVEKQDNLDANTQGISGVAP